MRIDIHDALVARNDCSIIGHLPIAKLRNPVLLAVEGEDTGLHELQELVEWMLHSASVKPKRAREEPGESGDPLLAWKGPLTRKPFSVAHIEPVRLVDGDADPPAGFECNYAHTLGSLLMVCARFRLPSRVARLIDMRADPMHRLLTPTSAGGEPEGSGMNVLHLAAYTKDACMVRTLLRAADAAAMPKAPMLRSEGSGCRQTPLHMALLMGADPFVTLSTVVDLGMPPELVREQWRPPSSSSANPAPAHVHDEEEARGRVNATLLDVFFSQPTDAAQRRKEEEEERRKRRRTAGNGEGGLLLLSSCISDEERQIQKVLHDNPTAIIMELLSHGAPVNVVDGLGETPLSLAVRRFFPWSESIVKLLLKAGASPDPLVCERAFGDGSATVRARFPVEDRILSNTPLMAAVETGRHSLVHLLLDAKAYPNSPYGKHGFRTPLMAAASGGHDAAVMLLVRHGASVTCADDMGRDAFHYAAMANRGSTIMLLRKLFPDYEPRNDDVNGNTPLHLAVQTRGMLAIKALLIGGREGLRPETYGLTATNRKGLTPVHAAAADGLMPFFEALQSLVPQTPELLAAVLRQDTERHDADDEGSTALHLAAANGHEPVVRWIMSLPAAARRSSSR